MNIHYLAIGLALLLLVVGLRHQSVTDAYEELEQSAAYKFGPSGGRIHDAPGNQTYRLVF